MMFTSNDYVPPYSITNQMVTSIALISDKIGRISVYTPIVQQANCY